MQENRNVLQLFRSTFIFAREQQKCPLFAAGAL
jgi:hypothetical protein